MFVIFIAPYIVILSSEEVCNEYGTQTMFCQS